MTIENHDLIHELPEFATKIHELKMSNAHFKKLFEEYHDLTHKIQGLEKQGVPMDDMEFEKLKKQRVSHKDELFKMLQSA